MNSDMSKPDERLVRAEQELREGARHFCLSDAGRSQEQERADGTREGFLRPARERRMALDRALIALSCEITRLCSSSSTRNSFCGLFFLQTR